LVNLARPDTVNSRNSSAFDLFGGGELFPRTSLGRGLVLSVVGHRSTFFIRSESAPLILRMSATGTRSKVPLFTLASNSFGCLFFPAPFSLFAHERNRFSRRLGYDLLRGRLPLHPPLLSASQRPPPSNSLGRRFAPSSSLPPRFVETPNTEKDCLPPVLYPVTHPCVSIPGGFLSFLDPPTVF